MHEPIPKYWFDGNPLITSLFNGLSVSIPEIERFIVGSVRDALPHVKSKELKKAVEILTHEEEAHARVHDTYNNLLRKQGYKISKHEAFEHSVAEFFNIQDIKTRLVVCLCSEFFTAVLGRHLIEAKIYTIPGVDARMSALWTWHSYEELHHRGTALICIWIREGGISEERD
jgi:predicted metal-dependent hydrolase